MKRREFWGLNVVDWITFFTMVPPALVMVFFNNIFERFSWRNK